VCHSRRAQQQQDDRTIMQFTIGIGSITHFVLSFGRVFKLEATRADFLLRMGRRELHWVRGCGWRSERVPAACVPG
jgi:hypothetical protein